MRLDRTRRRRDSITVRPATRIGDALITQKFRKPNTTCVVRLVCDVAGLAWPQFGLILIIVKTQKSVHSKRSRFRRVRFCTRFVARVQQHIQ